MINLHNLGIHVIQFPSQKFGFVGNLSLELATMVPATRSDIMAGRIVTDPNGDVWSYKFPVFPSKADAIAFALEHGIVTK
jgi:hypothetical protein